VVARYDYVDENGTPLFQVRRWEPGFGGRAKSFTQHAAIGKGRWRKGVSGVRQVVYRLPQVLGLLHVRLTAVE
jgi:hypothetical protein